MKFWNRFKERETASWTGKKRKSQALTKRGKRHWCYRSLFCFFIAMMSLAVLFSLVIQTWAMSDLDDDSILQGMDLITLSHIDQGNGKHLDEEWLPALENEEIIHLYQYKNGLALKFRAVLASGRQVMIKLAEIPHYLDGHPTRYEQLPISKTKPLLGRGGRQYQGWAELAGFYLDRVMGLYKKPPMIGRRLSNTVLYENQRFSIYKYLPTFNISVSMHAWVDGLHNKPPSTQTMKRLIHKSKIDSDSKSALEKCLVVSDALVNDVLVDDHDKKWLFNWKATKSNVNLHWDSGLGWVHGPIPRDTCLDLLCGTTQWIDMQKEVFDGDLKEFKCEKIGVFRKETIQYLRDHSSQQPVEERLSTMWIEAMKADPLNPLLEYAYFFENKVGHRVSNYRRKSWFFTDSVFAEGMDIRIDMILNYVDEIIDIHGEDRVLYSSSHLFGKDY